jgi:hypothetical protein
VPNRRPAFVTLAESVLHDSRIEPISRLIYLQLLIDARSYSENLPHEDYGELAAHIGITISQTKRAVKDLAKAGFLTFTSHGGGVDIVLTSIDAVYSALIRLAAI